MPTTYAHYRFGTEVYKSLPRGLRESIRPYLGLYCIGLHGPDVLFYYKAMKKNSVSETGFAMHARPGFEFFERAEDILRAIPSVDIAPSMAYLYGFLCHFALDSTCHPYVEQTARETPLGHCAIESEFDRILMEADGYDPLRFHPIRHLKATHFNARIIAAFFPEITKGEVLCAIRSQRTDLKLLAPKGALRRRILMFLMRLVHCPRSIHDMVITPEPLPGSAPICAQMLRLYETAVPFAAELIQNFQAYTEGTTPLDARLDHTFGEN